MLGRQADVARPCSHAAAKDVIEHHLLLLLRRCDERVRVELGLLRWDCLLHLHEVVVIVHLHRLRLPLRHSLLLHWVVGQVILWLLMCAVLDFGVSQAEELSKLSRAFVILDLHRFSTHDFEAIFLEGLNAGTGSVQREVRGKGRATENWLLLLGTKGARVQASH